MGYYYRTGMDSGSAAFLVICMLLAIVAAVLICVFVLPRKRRARLTGFLAKVHEFVNFNVLIIEKLLKVLYILCTCVAVFFGIFVLFAVNALSGLLIIVVGAVLIRVSYEITMLLVIGVNSLIQINKKTPGAPPCGPSAQYAPSQTPPAQAAPASAAPRMVYCTQCGTRYDASRGGCPNCGTAEG